MTQQPKSYEINHEAALAATFNQVALDPKRSIVVRACAGSGKTWLLTSRIIRLLLDGVSPQHILAITFTKKAAQEMRDRVSLILQGLADEPDAAVLKQLTERGLSETEAKLALPRARALYNDVLGSGQDIPIYTFHAWFYRLLQAAPMGSGVMRDASLLDDASELKELAWSDFYKRLNEDSSLLTHYLALIRELGEFTATKMLNESLSQATEIQLVTRECEHQGVTVLEALSQELLEETGIQVELGEASIYQRWSNELNAKGELDTLIQFLSVGDDKKQVLSQSLLNVFNANEPMAQYEVFKPYLKADGTLNKNNIKSTKAQLKQLEGQISEDDYDEAIETLNTGLSAIQMGFADVKALELHKDILPCVDVLINAYQNIKRRLRQLDFNDIEHQCFELLSNPNTAAYVQVQLDARYKHLLFDEFQDTSPLQWHIIHGWLDAYEHDALKPCVFVVGDVKQSIYRFRKADARLFDAAENLLVEKYQADVLKTHATRRNSRAVIEWVNGMFNSEECELTEFTSHTTFNDDVGQVACLSLTEAPADDEVSAPVDVDSESPAEIAPRDWLDEPLNVIQANVRDDESALLIESIQTLVGTFPVKDEDTNLYRPARYSDILLLVNTRTHLSGYERLLREAHIPFISSRRGGLLDTLEGEDMMALVQWLMTPNDDLSLMHVLRTPIFNASHDDLNSLLQAKLSLKTEAFSPSYWHVLNEINGLSGCLQRAKSLLNDWLLVSPHLPPHDVLDRIYAQGEVLKHYALVTPLWLNAQVQANLREFLQLALTVNSGRYPSLSSYLEALKLWQSLETDGASEAEPIGMNNAVRILTVHASKGLEAPIVMLIDMKVKADKAVSNKWFVDWPVDSIKPRHVSWLSTQSRQGDWRKAALDESNHYARIERWNQCYVAMTRARQLLLVSAAEVRQSSKTEEEGDSSRAFTPAKKEGLFDYLQKSLSQVSAENRLPASPDNWHEQVELWKTQTKDWHEPVDIASFDEKRLNSYTDFPEVQGVADAFRKQFLPKAPDYQDMARQEAALLGEAWHGAMQFAIENGGQRLSNDELVQRFNVSQAQAEQVQVWTQTTLQHPDHQKWFNPALYERAVNEMTVVTATGQVKRIDRWVKTGSDITVIDYKSDWSEENLVEYEIQVKEYVQLLSELYPACHVQGVLLDAVGRIHHVN